MVNITDIPQINSIEDIQLRKHLLSKYNALSSEYAVPMSAIGYVTILTQDEFTQFNTTQMEFVELMLFDSSYLHGVRIISDSYAEDVFLTLKQGGNNNV